MKKKLNRTWLIKEENEKKKQAQIKRRGNRPWGSIEEKNLEKQSFILKKYNQANEEKQSRRNLGFEWEVIDPTVQTKKKIRKGKLI